MGLFGIKKQPQKNCGCGSGECTEKQESTATASSKEPGGKMNIKVLGSGCKKCNQLEANTAEAMRMLGIEEPIEHVTDYAEIASYGVMSTPALVANGQVLLSGKVAKPDEIAALLKG